MNLMRLIYIVYLLLGAFSVWFIADNAQLRVAAASGVGVIDIYVEDVGANHSSVIDVSAMLTTQQAGLRADYHVSNYAGQKIDHNESGDSEVNWDGGNSHISFHVEGSGKVDVDAILQQDNVASNNNSVVSDGITYNGSGHANAHSLLDLSVSGNVGPGDYTTQPDNNVVVWQSVDGTTHGASLTAKTEGNIPIQNYGGVQAVTEARHGVNHAIAEGRADYNSIGAQDRNLFVNTHAQMWEFDGGRAGIAEIQINLTGND